MYTFLFEIIFFSAFKKVLLGITCNKPYMEFVNQYDDMILIKENFDYYILLLHSLNFAIVKREAVAII